MGLEGSLKKEAPRSLRAPSVGVAPTGSFHRPLGGRGARTEITEISLRQYFQGTDSKSGLSGASDIITGGYS